MTIETANALCRYFETLYSLNQNLMALCGEGIFDDKGNQSRLVDNIIMSIPRLIPLDFNKKTKKYRLAQAEGLMNFSDDIPFISGDYESILEKHRACLIKIKRIRNKLEHEMHGPRIVASSSGTLSLFAVTYLVSEENIDFCAQELIAFVKDMNLLFSKIQDLLKRSDILHQYDDHPYYRRLLRYDFSDFNKIFESSLLKIIGKALVPF